MSISEQHLIIDWANCLLKKIPQKIFEKENKV